MVAVINNTASTYFWLTVVTAVVPASSDMPFSYFKGTSIRIDTLI